MTNYSSSKYIKIIDRVPLSQSKYLLIVRVCDKNLLLSVSENNVSILKELENLEIENIENDNQNSNVKFCNIFMETIQKNKITSKLKKGNINYEGDEFSNKKNQK